MGLSSANVWNREIRGSRAAGRAGGLAPALLLACGCGCVSCQSIGRAERRRSIVEQSESVDRVELLCVGARALCAALCRRVLLP